MSTMVVNEPRMAHARKPQCMKDCANATEAASGVLGLMSLNSGGVDKKCAIGSPAAQNTPPPARRVHRIMAPHWKTENSGVSTPPNFTLLPGKKHMAMPITKVANKSICQ